MRRFLVDTWFFIAFIDRHDSHHRQSRRLAGLIDQSLFITTEAVLTEVLAFFADDDAYGRAAAVDAIRSVLRNSDVVAADTALFNRALDLYEARPDKAYSLVDCMSMVVMRDRGITHVLTNDHHFRQEGFTVVSE